MPVGSWTSGSPEGSRVSFATRLRDLRRLRPEEIRLLVTGVVVLPLLVAGIRIAGFRKLLRWMARGPASEAPRRGDLERAETVSRMVAAAGRHGVVKATCLPRSLLAWWLLRREGIDAEIRIGVRRPGDALAAHAWVEHRGHPLGPDIESSRDFASFEAAVARGERRTG